MVMFADHCIKILGYCLREFNNQPFAEVDGTNMVYLDLGCSISHLIKYKFYSFLEWIIVVLPEPGYVNDETHLNEY